ncbi:protein translocase subunit SecD [Candidatus Roizmanbacteria bacterium CG_4_9_14_3_um_filter_33_18]|uniref:Protein translocase subunit SecD n=3 Tax=Candidatus Roizmaniibacteriota TaxID=1752723 RepID=A0A2M7U8X8_9BACT|nr:MAG: protein translocase subunit SecD [Candidatus Roizmanbacteria bacterium CG22_combo_CG10-13_8_21_14_all_34_12]PIZ67691.1 MAG: protein translocase subunit SecD [Candidatus Roizmanbacteria bacterium CG_4_10_14_0_2_um_filter_33_96]PJA55577.1 MAG: protein translocase subunit SecD [Candidatus Roizmanbacteria bacterium CG_4_9_14_3_um_filter_33_18]
MKIFKSIIIALVFLGLIWVDLPENIKTKYKIPSQMNFSIFGLNVKKDFTTKLGLDLKGGSSLIFEADISKVKKEDLNDALNSARDVIERRINFFGVTEPQIQTVKTGDKYRLSVDLPGINNYEEAIKLIGQTAQLTFRELPDGKIATNTPIFLQLTKDTGLSGIHILKSTVEFDNQTGKPEVGLKFNKKGTDLFAAITKRNIGKSVGIFLDNIPLTTPTVSNEIPDGSARITGNFTSDEVKKLTIAINSGALPLPIKLVEQKNIGPSLGETEVRKSVYAGTIGLIMVLIFMIIYYGRLGFIASLALLIYGLISLFIFKAIPLVLTLPGIAGFILSIGMAVDSNILIFERIKEELRAGKNFDIAVRLGFGRAIDAIKDANITTLTVAFILFNPLNWEFLPQFGMVRGFALTLAIGVGTSLFTGVVITKRLINLFYKTR